MTSLLEKNLTLRVKNDKRFASTWKAIRCRSSTPRLGAPPSRGRGRGSCARAKRRGRAAPRGYRRLAGRGARGAAEAALEGAGPVAAGRAER